MYGGVLASISTNQGRECQTTLIINTRKLHMLFLIYNFIIEDRVTQKAAGKISRNCNQALANSNTKQNQNQRKEYRINILSRTLIARRVLIQIQLVVLLSIPPLSRLQDLCRDRLLIPFLADLVRDLMRDLVLLLTVREDSAAVLGAHVRALTVLGCGVVHAVEEFEELAVADYGGIKGYLEGFGVWGSWISAKHSSHCYPFLFSSPG